jgi:cytochrome P450
VADTLIYDPYSRPFQEDPYPLYRRLRDETPCAYNPDMDFYALFRFEDVWNATLDWETISSSLGPILENRGQVPPHFFSIIGMDPPAHTKLRNVISRGFTPRRIAALEEEIRSIAKGYLEPLSTRDHFDFEQEFAVKFPMDVISALLGIPEEDRDAYRHGIDQGLSRDPDGGLDERRIATIGDAQDYMARLIAERRKNPREDLVTVLAQAEFEDALGVRRPLSDDETKAFVTLLAAAGAETTAKLLGNAMYLLWKHPDQRQACWNDLAKLTDAVEETLRYEAPSQFQGRVASVATTR